MYMQILNYKEFAGKLRAWQGIWTISEISLTNSILNCSRKDNKPPLFLEMK